MWNLNGWEMIGLLLLALFIFGPERLPKVISDGVRMLRNLRDLARNATTDLSRELGTEVRLEDLHPKTFIRKHLLSEEEEADLRRPFDDAYQDVRQIAADANDYDRPHPELPPAPRTGQRDTDPGYRGHEQRPGGYDEQGPGGYEPERRSYDSDAT
jgi:sec-independent protein translocase protein TatB